MAYDAAVRAMGCPRPTNYPLGLHPLVDDAVLKRIEQHLLSCCAQQLRPLSDASSADTTSTHHQQRDQAPGAAAVKAEVHGSSDSWGACSAGQAMVPQVLQLQDMSPLLSTVGSTSPPELNLELSAIWNDATAAELLAASPQGCAPQLRLCDVLQDTSPWHDSNLTALLADLQADADDSMPGLQQPTASSTGHTNQAQQHAWLLAGLGAGSFPPVAVGSCTATACLMSLEQPLVFPAAGAPHPLNSSPLGACAGPPVQLLTPAKALPCLASAGEVVSFVDMSVAHLMQLYQHLTQHAQQHTGLVAIRWVAGVRASVTQQDSSSSSSGDGTCGSSSSAQSVRSAVLHTCVNLVSLGAGSGGAAAPGVQHVSPLLSSSMLVSVVEGLVHTLLSLKALCCETSSASGPHSSTFQLGPLRQQLQAGAVGSSVGQLVAALLDWL